MANPEVYRRRRAAGLCGSCGEVKTGSKARCDACKAKELDAKKARYEARKAAGLCPQCGNPASDAVLCDTCRAKQTGAAARYQRNKAKGVCRACGRDSGGEAYCAKHKAKQREYHQRLYAKRKQESRCYGCGKPTDGTTRCPECLERDSETQRARNRRLRDAAFAAYGGAKCALCGEEDPTILEIDHINGGGNAHRRAIGPGRLYIWLAQNKYPPGFRVLCPTCNKKAHVQARACP